MSKRKFLLILVAVLALFITTRLFNTSSGTNEKLLHNNDGDVTLLKEEKTDSDFQNISFWKYEDYQVWVKEQSEILDSLVDSGARYKENGKWHTWTAEEVQETKDMYLANLAKIKDGYQLEKVLDEDEAELIVYPLDDTSTSVTSDTDSLF